MKSEKKPTLWFIEQLDSHGEEIHIVDSKSKRVAHIAGTPNSRSMGSSYTLYDASGSIVGFAPTADVARELVREKEAELFVKAKEHWKHELELVAIENEGQNKRYQLIDGEGQPHGLVYEEAHKCMIVDNDGKYLSFTSTPAEAKLVLEKLYWGKHKSKNFGLEV